MLWRTFRWDSEAVGWYHILLAGGEVRQSERRRADGHQHDTLDAVVHKSLDKGHHGPVKVKTGRTGTDAGQAARLRGA